MEGSRKRYQYLDSKEGEKTILILHGLAGNKETICSHTKYFHNKFRCIYLDLPGHNDQPIGTIKTLDDFGEYVLNFTRDFDINSFGILGYSFGGEVALNMHSQEASLRDVPTCLWVSPAIGKTRIKSNLLIQLAKIIPYESWDPYTLLKMIHFVDATFTLEDIIAIKRTNKSVFKFAPRILKEIDSFNKGLNLFTVMDPNDPFVRLDKNMKYDVVMNKCGHAGEPEQVDLAIKEISSFFNRNL